MSEEETLYKIILVGETAVGKSSILVRFTDNTFTPHFAPTLGVDFNVKTIRNKETGQTVKLQLWDTAGQERFKSITQTFYRGSHGVIVVYDITDSKSFDRCRNWIEDINNYSMGGMIMILVGNKSDLPSRKVTYEQGKALADELGIKFLETSAKDNVGVNAVFDTIVQDIQNIIINSTPTQNTIDNLGGEGQQRKPCCGS
ncbi:Rab GTPase [Heterostelium album PN500]|uniref:Rab GTPase n=1 Tax=Heterostelium pallidum (strain ATCC 26659 / Pp 5 / PN500) TaxID=670386 RepID=D3BMH1_HETP5|nr:Rab GTPase [Heterostelium album PN500]EFA77183.1 Rab GTPase [Heterostelium album PN500]|eukprot:XP_020429312.1 Rab GTPase [Heterostelium album PN500]